jgi:hypothetical protein
VPVIEGGPTLKCWSGTGSVSRYWKGRQERIVSGLPSTYLEASGFAAGPQDIGFQGRGNALVLIGLGGPGGPALRALFGPQAAALGSLVELRPHGGWRVLADLAAYEAAYNPGGGLVDSNPYGLLAAASRTFVVDAGGNSLIQFAASGELSLLAVFPPTPAPPPFGQADAVPTRVVRGPDGALYVGTLSGVPFLAGSAAVYRVLPGRAPVLYAGGFKAITDLAFGPDGSLYVLQFASAVMFLGGPGSIIRIEADGTRTPIVTDLVQPTGLAVGSDGSIYVSNRGTASGGEVLRITH